MKPTRVINVHGHILPGQSVDERIRHYDRPCVLRTFLFGPVDLVIAAQKAAPDRICAFPQMTLGDARPEDFERARDLGAKGFKFHAPRHRKPFDAPEFWPVYDLIQQMQLPVVFHTGYSATLPGMSPADINCLGMHPFTLDAICRNFDRLRVVGAHLGQPWCDDACLLSLKHPNLYWDLSGGTLRCKPPSFWQRLTATAVEPELRSLEETVDLKMAGKWVFGTDSPSPDKFLTFYDNLTELLAVPRDTCEDIYWRNAAKMLGMSERDF